MSAPANKTGLRRSARATRARRCSDQIRKAEEYHTKMVGARNLTLESSAWPGLPSDAGLARSTRALSPLQLMPTSSPSSSRAARCATTSSKGCNSARSGTCAMRASFLRVSGRWSDVTAPTLTPPPPLGPARRDGARQDRPDHLLRGVAQEEHRPDARPHRRPLVYGWVPAC